MGGSGENVQLRIYAGSVNTDPSGLEGFSTSAGLPGNSHCPVFAVKNVFCIIAFCLISLLIVSMYINFGLPLGLAPTSMSSTVLVIWLSSLHLTCPYQRSRSCIRCVVTG